MGFPLNAQKSSVSPKFRNLASTSQDRYSAFRWMQFAGEQIPVLLINGVCTK